MRKQKVSSAVIRRLPRYYRHLNELHLSGTVRISSSALGKSMGLTASQIRQDLSCFGEFGQQGYGYNVEKLRGEISDILGMNSGHTAVVLGAGNLGRALIENFHFELSGFHLAAAFDVAPGIVGTVMRRVAAETAARLVAGGVRGLWNFTNIELDLRGSDVVVENVHFADSLLALSYMISE